MSRPWKMRFAAVPASALRFEHGRTHGEHRPVPLAAPLGVSNRSVLTVSSPDLQTQCARGYGRAPRTTRTQHLRFSYFRSCQPMQQVAPLDANAAAGSTGNFPLAAPLGVSNRSVLTVSSPVLQTQCARGYGHALHTPRTPHLRFSYFRSCQQMRQVAPLDADAAAGST